MLDDTFPLVRRDGGVGSIIELGQVVEADFASGET
jgi:hypothetical protein